MGIRATSNPWLLFLDADDMLAPHMLDRMMEALAGDPSADGAHCGWIYTDPKGREIGVRRCEEEGRDLFPVFARYCAFAVHACVIRRSTVTSAGSFDVKLRTCEDFDLWQRVARMGAAFIPVDEHLVYYRLRPHASWFDAANFAQDALRVIRRGHGHDPRLSGRNPNEEHINGEPRSKLAQAEFQMIVWAGAIAIARHENTASLIGLTERSETTRLDAAQIADTIYTACPLTLCLPASEWPSLWPSLSSSIRRFLTGLSSRVGDPSLAGKVLAILEHRVATRALDKPPESSGGDPSIVLVGSVAAVCIETSMPIPDISLPGIDRMLCAIRYGGEYLGTLLLPVCDGVAPAIVTADAIADRFAWILLQRVFERQVYPSLRIERDAKGWSVLREGTLIADGLPGTAAPTGPALHDEIGWAVFAQELLALPDWTVDSLYDGSISHPDSDQIDRQPTGLERIELGGLLPRLTNAGLKVSLELLAGGVPFLRAAVATCDGIASAGALRAAILDQGKMEIARAVAREAVLGFPVAEATPLRARLQARASQLQPVEPIDCRILSGSPAIRNIEDCARLVGWTPGEKGPMGGVLVLGPAKSLDARHYRLRRSTLPAACADLLLSSLEPGQPAVRIGEGAIVRAFFLPELRSETDQSETIETPRTENRGAAIQTEAPATPATITALPESEVSTDRLPILAYHHVAPKCSETVNSWCVSPEQFDAQLSYLCVAGYRTATLDEWGRAQTNRVPLPGNRIIISFDGLSDFAEHAIPILRRHGFSALVFLPTDFVGDQARCDHWSGEAAPLMDWKTLRSLQNEGVVIGSQGATHRRLTDLTPVEIVTEACRSRAALADNLGIWPDGIAYPSGVTDEAVMRLTGACGYAYGLTSNAGLTDFDQDPLNLSRVQIRGDFTLDHFIAALDGVA